MTMPEALAALGVTPETLTVEERRSLDERGFVLLTGVIDAGWLDRPRARYEELMKAEGQSAGAETHQETGARRLADLVNKGEVFDRLWAHPRVLAAAWHVIRTPFRLYSLNGRDAIPGDGLQGFHADWGPRQADEPFHILNSVWMLDDFTAENGATRILPGSHRRAGGPGDHLADPLAPHPDEVVAVAPAGSVLAFNAHCWHGGTLNRTRGTRRGLHSAYGAREYPQQLNQAEFIRVKTFNRISPAARYLLDV
jgi:hypothetical protein